MADTAPLATALPGALDFGRGPDDSVIDALRETLQVNASADALSAILTPLHAADVADLLELLNGSERAQLLQRMGSRLDAEVWAHLDESVRDSVIETLEPERLAEILAALESDDAVDLIGRLNPVDRERLLGLVPASARTLYEQSLSWPEHSAGRLMRRETVTVPESWATGNVIDLMRRNRHTLPEDFYNIVIIDVSHHPIGLVKLSRLLQSERRAPVREIMDSGPTLIPATMDQEDAAFLFRKYGLVEAPVVDDSGRLAGMITVDDIVHVLDEEHGKNLLGLGGVLEDDFYADVAKTSRLRFLWLLVNLGTAIAASFVIAAFSATVQQIIALAVLAPIVASMGGNAGTQTLTVAVRALSLNELTAANAVRMVGKETLVGLLNGVLFALLVGGVAWLWFRDPTLGLVVGLAMVTTMLAAGLAGILIPLLLNHWGQDPAAASTVFLTTVTDIVGFFTFLALATWILL